MNVVPTGLEPGPEAAAAAYEIYYSSGAYDRRYPAANGGVLALIRRCLPQGGHVIDYGCGSGRYLLALRHRAGVAAGFDICRAGLSRLRAAVRGEGHGAVDVLGPDPRDLERHVARHGPADLALCLFGVLSHVEGRAERRKVLLRLRGLLRPGTGRLILSVPNRRRRFLALQRTLPPGQRDEIRYVRRLDPCAIELPYKLFDPHTLTAELEAAGFAIERLSAESLFPESAIGQSPRLGRLDRLVRPLVPAAWGYGILAVARPAPLPRADGE